MFEYEFMQKAFLVGGALAIIMPLMGLVIVLRRLSMLGDALSHSSLTGITAGLAFGFNPIVGAVISTILAAFGIEIIRKKLPQYSDISIAIITSAGLGIAGILTSFVSNATGFNSFLFGSIVSIKNSELIFVLSLSLIVLISLIILSKELFFIAIDERGAILSGVPVNFINTIFTILTAITIAIASRTVGALIVSSIMVIPVASSMQLTDSFKKTALLSVMFGLIATFLGLTISFYLGLKPGACIVLISLVILISSIALKNILKK